MQLNGISSMATRHVLTDICAAYAQDGGERVQFEAVGGVDAAGRVAAGEAFDLVVLARDAIDKLIASGHLLAASRVDLVKSPIAAAMQAGARQFDLSTVAGLKDALHRAASISYSTGPSGVYLAQLFVKLGIAEQVKAKIVVPPPGVPVGSLVAAGKVQLGFQQLSELMHLPGIAVLGSLPQEVAYITTFSAAVPSQASMVTQQAAARFLAFANSVHTVSIKQAQGMKPA